MSHGSLSRRAKLAEQRPLRYYTCGIYFGKILCIVLAVQVMFLWVLEILYPASEIDEAPEIKLEVIDADVESEK